MRTRSLTHHVAALTATLALVLSACNQGAEGDRCNPDLSHDECSGDLRCTTPVDCPESYCCPADGKSDDPFCQPGCNGGQASMCAAGADADCWELDDGAVPTATDAGGDAITPADAGAGG